MSNPITQQQLKVLPVQFGGALLCVGLYLLFDAGAWKPLIYSVGVGVCYSIMLYFGVVISNRLTQDSPQSGMAVLAFFAVLRFVLTGLLIMIGFKYWAKQPLALMLPFVVVLIAPILLVPFKKRLTD